MNTWNVDVAGFAHSINEAVAGETFERGVDLITNIPLRLG